MNVIISNKYQAMLQELNIDVIKHLNGVFEVDELVEEFQHFYYQRMILDITALKNYQDATTLQKLSIALDMDKVILLLDETEDSTSPDYLSKLISMGIYNFTRNLEGIMYLYNNPNTYRDVAQYHQLNNIVEVEKEVPVTTYITVNGQGVQHQQRLIGIQNITKQSGATTLIYMMKKLLEKNYYVIALELDKRDFIYFRDKEMYSISSQQLGNELAKHKDADIILVDVNHSVVAESLMNEMLYLIEPSVIKLNKLMMMNPKALQKYRDKKVILNQSLINSKDLLDFEYESKLKLFYNMPPLDEREKHIPVLNNFLIKMGFSKQKSE